jgi:Zn-finger nucleic acid-binding protein
MLCPVCKGIQLQPAMLKKGLAGFRCIHCSGTWVSAQKYQPWLEKQNQAAAETPAQETTLPVLDNQQAKVCPECGHMLGRYQIRTDVDFHLDHCHSCSGVWLDANEWDALIARGLDGKLNLFFSQEWQQELRDAETQRRLNELYTTRFGDVDYTRVKEMREWLGKHPQRAALLAFLQLDNPYKLK